MRDNKNMMSLEKCGIEIIGGQIMSRVTVKDVETEDVAATYKVVVPKSIGANGKVNADEMPEENLRAIPDAKRVTEVGDIVMKLSTPYDAGRVEEASAGCIVPSFCAIIKSSDTLDSGYLLAFLNSNACKNQLKAQVAGSVMAMLSVGKIKNVMIPVPGPEKQKEISEHFLETQRRLAIIEQIIALEQKKNDIYFRELVNEYGEE